MSKLKTKILALTPFLLFLIVRLQFFDVQPRWDSSEYYHALLRTINELKHPSLESFIQTFSWLGHPAHGFGILSLPFALPNPLNPKFIHYFNTLLGLIAIYSFQKIITYFHGTKNRFYILLAASVFAVHPMFISNSIMFSPDYGAFVFLITTLAAIFYKRRILTFFSALILAFSKEIGALSLAALAGMFIVAKIGIKIKKPRLTKIIESVPLVVPILLYAAFLVFNGGKWKPDGNNFLAFGDNCRFCFSIKQFNILEYLKVFFILNYNWVVTGISLLGLIKIITTKEKTVNFPAEKLKATYLLFAPFFVVIVFYLVFIIYVYTRYCLLYLGPFLILFTFLTRYVFHNKKILNLFMLVLFVLLLGQNFASIDPISNKVFGNVYIANKKFLTVGTEYLGDGLIYNTQFAYIDRLVGKFITKYSIDKNDTVFVDPYIWGNHKVGWGYFPNSQPKIIYKPSEIKTFPDSFYYLDFPVVKYGGKEIKKLEYGYIPPMYEEGYIINKLKDTFYVKSLDTINADGYWINVYFLTAKKSK